MAPALAAGAAPLAAEGAIAAEAAAGAPIAAAGASGAGPHVVTKAAKAPKAAKPKGAKRAKAKAAASAVNNAKPPKAVSDAARSGSRKALAPTRKAGASVAGLVWRVLGIVVALSLLLLVLQAAESGPRLAQATTWSTDRLRKFVNPFGDDPLKPKGPSKGAARAARSAATTTVNPNLIHV